MPQTVLLRPDVSPVLKSTSAEAGRRSGAVLGGAGFLRRRKRRPRRGQMSVTTQLARPSHNGRLDIYETPVPEFVRNAKGDTEALNFY
jgi:hypothetical protein